MSSNLGREGEKGSERELWREGEKGSERESWRVCFATFVAGDEINITYSYWDGSGHRRRVKVGVSVCIQSFSVVNQTPVFH